MGNRSPKKQQQQRTISLAVTQIDSKSYSNEIGCFISTSPNKKKKKQRQTWKINIEQNCIQLGETEYPWVTDVLKAANVEQEIQRSHYLKEVQQIQFRFQGLMTEIQAQQNLDDQNLFNALEKSILITQQVLKNRKQLGSEIKSINPIKKTLTCSYVGATMGTTATRTMNTNSSKPKRTELISFVDQSMSSLFKKKQCQLDDQSKQDIRLFIKLSQLLQRHTSDPANNLSIIKDEFVAYFSYIYSKSSYEVVIKQLLAFIDLYKITIVDYYKLDKVSQFFHSDQILDEDNLTNLITSIIFKDQRVYLTVFKSFSEHNKQNQKLFLESIDALNKIGPSDFHIADQYCLNQKTLDWYMEKLVLEQCIENVQIQAEHFNPYESCIAKIRQLETAKTPMAKLKVMISCAQKVSACMKQFYESNSLDVKKSIVDADQILSIFEFIIANSKMNSLYTHLQIIHNFANKAQMRSMAGYYYSVIYSALEHISKAYKQKI